MSSINRAISNLLTQPQKIPRNLTLVVRLIWYTKILSRDLVVVFRPWGVGDAICLLSCVPGLRRRHTNSWIVFITPPDCWHLIASSRLIDAAADRDSFFHQVVKSACTPSLYYSPTYPEGRVPEQAQTFHLADEFGRALGVAPDLSCVRLRPSGRARRNVARWLSEVNPHGNPIVVFHPGATWPVREWPHQSWCELAELISAHSEAVMIRIGTNVESTGRVRTLEPIPGTIDWSNELDVMETAALLDAANALVGIDSGPFHIAGALGRFSVGLFGPTSGHLRAYPNAPVALITADVSCLGCHHSPTGHLHWKTGCPHDVVCMRQIGARTVFEAVAPHIVAGERDHGAGRSTSYKISNRAPSRILGDEPKNDENLPLVGNRLSRFARKPRTEKWAAIKATLKLTFRTSKEVQELRHLRRLITGAHAPPRVLEANEKLYLAYRPDSDVVFSHHPEIAGLSEKWISENVTNNAGDLPRFYALILNVKQILDEKIPGEMAELGVFRGNSAAILANYARNHGKIVILFDTFEGFDTRDLVGAEENRAIEFADTSLEYVRRFLGQEGIRFVQGRFPESVPHDLEATRFCVAHIDCDLYEPAKSGLNFFYPRLSPGGLLIVHDYANPHWDGIKRAVDEFCSGIPEKLVVFGDKSGTAMIRKNIPFSQARKIS